MCESNPSNVNINSLSSADELEDGTNMEFEDNTQQNDTELIRGKRPREETSSEEGWSVVNRGRSKVVCNRGDLGEREKEQRTQVAVSCKEPLPKQFALARILKTHNIASNKIFRIKYVHRNKMLITFDTDFDADEFINCPVFTEMGWSCQKTSEVGVSYGLIRSMELEISDKDLKANLSSSAEIISIKRLNKRCPGDLDGNGWTPSETIRLGFKGPSLPPYVYIHSLRIPVERFVFPVTQCANCWKYGHLKIRCPSKNLVCPKCSQKHENCTSTSFSCVNCLGDHMAFDKICPFFKKEKKLRDLMSEFNCSYRRALTLYVPPSPANVPHIVSEPIPAVESSSTVIATTISAVPAPLPTDENVGTVSQVVCPSTSTLNQQTKPLPKRNLKKQNRRPATPTPAEDMIWNEVSESSDSSEKINSPHLNKIHHSDNNNKAPDNLNFWYLIRKIKNIIRSTESLQNKIQQSISIFSEWLTHKIVSSLSIDVLFNLFVGNG